MIRQNIIVGDYVFVADLYKAHQDIKDNIYKSEWVMLRHFDVINTIAYDTDIYFIERSIMKEAIENITKKNFTTDKIVYPTLENKYTGYSSNYKDFNDDYNYYSFKLNQNYDVQEDWVLEDDTYCALEDLTKTNTDIYNLFDSDYKLKQIECDTIKLYHPICIKKLDTIIYIDNYINNIHFHYFCQKYENLETKSETEFEDYHNRYSEYVEFHIPNIEFLFEENNVFFNEDLNLVSKEVKDKISLCNTIYDNKIWETIKTEISSDKYNNYFFRIKTDYGSRVAQFSFKKDDLVQLDTPNDYGQYITYIKGKKIGEEYVLYYNTITKKYTLIINENSNLVWFENITNRVPADYNYVSYVYWDTDEKKGDSDIYYQKQIALLNNETVEIYNKDFSLIPLNTLLLSFTIDKDRDVNSETYGYYIKKYIQEKQGIWTNYISWPINLTLYPYEYLDDNTNLYILDEYINSNSDTFQNGCRFTLSSKFGFDNGIISVINIFKYPPYKNFETIQEAYKFFNNVTENDYSSNNSFFDGDDYKDEDEKYEAESKIKYCGYRIEIASDIKFSDIVFDAEENLDFIDDFSFRLNDLFHSWNEMPEVLVLRVSFIDKYLCHTIHSNFIMLTKEWFKYLINNTDLYRLKCLVNRQEHIDTEGKRRYLYWDGNNKDDKKDNPDIIPGPTNMIWNKIYKSLLNTSEDMNTEYFNYIDKINCVIRTKKEDNGIQLNTNNNQQILFRPVFYKVSDAQNIKIRENVTQNIGINLGAYMNKVETFYLFIDDLKYEEYGRNDIFVLFRINAIDLTNTSGKYDIVNEDNEYITTGRWSIY